jgi:hypothetical protein
LILKVLLPIPLLLTFTSGTRILLGNLSVGEANLQNGDMIYIQVDEEISGIHETSQTGRFITKDGNIVAQSYDESANKLGFRPGMMALRDIKKQWTLREFESLDSQFVYKIKKAENPICKIASLDQNSLDSFQLYMRNFNFQRLRVGYLYGRFLEDNTAQVEFIYEPPQDSTPLTFSFLADDHGVCLVSDFSLPPSSSAILGQG